MGVYGLLSFARSQPDICRDDNIVQAMSNSKRSNCLIVDISNCQHRLSYEKNTLNKINGGRYLKQLQDVKKFVQKFENNDIRCIFVEDGSCCPPGKRDTKIQRKKEKLIWYRKIFDALDLGEDVRGMAKEIKSNLFHWKMLR